MKKFFKVISLFCICIITCSLSACALFENEDNNEVYEVDNTYFKEATFERSIYTNISFENNQSAGTSYEYIIEVSSKCSVSLFEYSIESKFYDNTNKLLTTFEKSVTKDISANERFKVACAVTFEIYSTIDHISTTLTGKTHQKSENSSSNIPTTNREHCFKYSL